MSGVSARWRPPLVSEHLQLSTPLSLSCCPLPSFLHCGSHPLSTSLGLPSLCVAAPSSQQAERKEGKSAWGGGIMRARGEARRGSDRVSALSEAFHHTFVAVCTPASQSPHSKLLLLPRMLLCVPQAQTPPLALIVLLLLLLQQRESGV